MLDYVTLMAAETVQHAARSMHEAAEEMKRAASWINESQRQQRGWMEDWLSRFEAVIKETK